jgi:hypothetical protein
MIVEKRLSRRAGYTSPVDAYQVQPSRSGYIFEVSNEQERFPAVDISHTGIRLATSRTLPISAILKLKLALQPEKPVDVFARVVWSNQAQTGLKFIVLHEEAKQDLSVYMTQVV